MINFRTIGVPPRKLYHENKMDSMNYTCGCWQCCKIDSNNNLSDFESSMDVYRNSHKWLDHHYD